MRGLKYSAKPVLLRHKGVHGHKRVHVRGAKMIHSAVSVGTGLDGHFKFKSSGGKSLGPKVGGGSLGAVHQFAGFVSLAVLQGLSHL